MNDEQVVAIIAAILVAHFLDNRAEARAASIASSVNQQ